MGAKTSTRKHPFLLAGAAAGALIAAAIIITGAFTGAPQTAFAAGADKANARLTTTELGAQAGGAITRAEWIAKLVETFDMTIEAIDIDGEEVYEYPDDYFEDVTYDHEYFYDIMKATDFGVIDTPAGENFNPDDSATREFAAHTLNYCLGFQLDEGAELTYSTADTAYPEDMQVALNRGWFGTAKVNAKADLAQSEASAMVADAQDVLAATAELRDQGNDVQLAANVKVVSADVEYSIDGTTVDADGDGIPDDISAGARIIIVNCPIEIAAGDLFAVYSGDLPVAFKAIAVAKDGNATIITIGQAGEEAYESLVYSGENELDLTQFQESAGVTTQHYLSLEAAAEDGAVTGGFTTQGLAAQGISYNNGTLSFSGGVGATNFTGSLTGVKAKYGADKKKDTYYVTVNGTIALQATLSGKAEVDIPFGYATNGVFTFFVGVKAGCEGSITETISANFEVGAEYSKSSGFRLIKEFKKGNPGLHAQASAAIRLEASASAKAPGIDAYVRARLGYGADYIEDIYNDGKRPNHCEDFEAHLFADAKASATFGFGPLSKIYKKEYIVWDSKNSPVRMHTHIEDGSPHDPCSRGKQYDHKGRWGKRWGGYASSDGWGEGGGPVEYAWYEYEDDPQNAGGIIITKYHGNYRALIVPETVDGRTITGIGESSFEKNSYLTSVILPSKVTHIDNGAFNECRSLSIVTVPESCKVIRSDAFRDCAALATINIPKDLNKDPESDDGGTFYESPFVGCESLTNVNFAVGTTFIAQGLFAESGLTQVTIPNTVTKIHDGAFRKCEKLASVNWGKALTEIGGGAFEECTALTSATLPDSMLMIHCGAFQNCDSITSIYIPKNMDVDNLVNYGASAPFAECDGNAQVTFATGITRIPNGLFKDFIGLQAIALPDTVTKVTQNAFGNCTGLKTVAWSSSLTSIEGSAFGNCTALTSAVLPDTVTYLGGYAFGNCDALAETYIPAGLATDGLIDYGGGAPFEDCDGNTKVTLAEGRTVLPLGLFQDFRGLAEVKIPSSVEMIERFAFRRATGLKKIEIPTTVTKIEYGAFRGSGLTEISVPDSVTDLGAGAFADCADLAKVTLPTAIDEIGSELLRNTAIAEITIPDAVVKIGSDAFRECANLSSVNWGKNVTKLGDDVFRDCMTLKTVTIPTTVLEMGAGTFYHCNALTTATIPSSVVTIGSETFYDCDALTTATLGIGIPRIGREMFRNCDALETIVVPARVSSIDENAFAECVKLANITIPAATTEIDDSAFSYPTKMTVYGETGTTAETWAKAKGAKFVAVNKPATSVTLIPSELTMFSGEEAWLVADVQPADFTGGLQWKVSGDKDAISFEEDTGRIYAEEVGTATIKLGAGDKTATCTVNVIQPVTWVDIWIEGNDDRTVDCGDVFQMSTDVRPDSANDKTLEWASSDPTIATVDETGTVTALAAGTVTIKATAKDRGIEYDECTITVKPVTIATSVDELESAHPYANDFDGSWKYTLVGATSLVVKFDARTMLEEDDDDYIYVYAGDGTEVGRWGGAELAGKTVDVADDTVKIRLVSNKSFNGWGFKVESVTAGSGGGDDPDPGPGPGPVEPTVIAVPAGTSFTYDGTEHTGVAAGAGYSLSGTAKATAVGDYTATATLNSGYIWEDGTTAPKSIAWSITAAPEPEPEPEPAPATITAKDVKVAMGKTTKLGATVNSGATLSYESSNTKVAKVSSKGVVTPVAKGAATITITAPAKGSYAGAKKTIKVTVTQGAQSVTFKAQTKKASYSKVKKAKQVVTISAAKAKTKVTYSIAKALKGKANAKKYFTIAGSTGKITVKKGTPKGTYKVTVKAAAKKTTSWKAASKSVIITIKVK